MTVTAARKFNSVRVYINGILHVDICLQAYRGLTSWRWQGSYKIEISHADGSMLLEYDDEALWREVLAALDGFALNED